MMKSISVFLSFCLIFSYLFNKVDVVEATEIDMSRSIQILPNIQYGKLKRQALDIFVPPGKGSFPVVFFVHGGAWSAGNRDMYGSAGYFYAKNNYVVVLVDHRLSPEVSHPSHIEDVAKAFVWTRNNIVNFKGDTSRIYIAGHSSGAHLVSLLATNEKYLIKENGRGSDIRGVVTISGIYSLGANISLVGYGHIFPTKKDKFEASPINFINKSSPPFLILYADNDIVTLGRQATNFHKELIKKSVRSSIYCVKGENHTTILFDCITTDRSSNLLLNFMR